jgi:hypothetical protein
MNTQIQQLAEQAKVYADYYGMLSDSAEQEIFTEKFAELIVKKCADIAKHHVMNISTYGDADFVDEQIKQHFGVEE